MDESPNQRRQRGGARRRSEPERSLGSVIEQVALEKGTPKSVLIESFEKAVLNAAQRAFGPARKLEASFNEHTGEIDLYQFVTVVQVVNEAEHEVSLDALMQNGALQDSTLGDELGFQVFWRPEDAAAAHEQDRSFGDVMPPIHDADRSVIYNEYKARKAELLPQPAKPDRKRKRAVAWKF